MEQRFIKFAHLLALVSLPFLLTGATIVGGGGGGTSGWPTVSTTKEATWATSLANAMRIGDGVTPLCLYTDATLGPVIRPCTDANTRTYIWTDFTWCLFDVEGNACMLTVDPDAVTQNGKYTWASAARPTKTIYWDAGAINVDGSNCTVPTEQSLNGSGNTWAFVCADSNSSVFSGKIRMPKRWDGGTVTFTLSLYHATTESITFAGDFSARCRGAGDAIDSTYGTAQAADVAITTANLIAEATTAAVTPNGSCAGNKFLSWKYVVDAANFSTNAANSKVLGVAMTWSEGSLSD